MRKFTFGKNCTIFQWIQEFDRQVNCLIANFHHHFQYAACKQGNVPTVQPIQLFISQLSTKIVGTAAANSLRKNYNTVYTVTTVRPFWTYEMLPTFATIQSTHWLILLVHFICLLVLINCLLRIYENFTITSW